MFTIVTQSTFAELSELRPLNKVKYSTNTMTVIRTSQQNGEVLELYKRAKSGIFVRKKCGQRSAIDEEALVVFLSCCLRFVSGRGRLLEHSMKNDVGTFPTF